VDEILPDGTYLSRLKAPRKLRKDGAADITVRVVEYRLEDARRGHRDVHSKYHAAGPGGRAGPGTGGAV
jgi:hypothetical protein